MKILILSDLHIAKNTPWNTDYEDIKYLCSQIENTTLPEFDACIIAGDIFNVSRIKPEDIWRFIRLLDVLGVYNRPPVFAIGGNHDPHDPTIASCIPEGVTLYPEDILHVNQDITISGMMYSPDLDKVREYLRTTQADIVVCHQSVQEFINIGSLGADQLKVSDFPKDRLCIVGDTHITSAIPHGEGAVLSPGILCPMRSRAELLESNPQLVWFDTEEGLHFESLQKRFAGWFNGEPASVQMFEKHLDTMPSWEPDMIMYVPDDLKKDLPKTLPERTKVLFVSKAAEKAEMDLPEVDVDDIEGTSASIIKGAVESMIDTDDIDRSTIVSLVGDIAASETPEDPIKNYLQS